jgi:RNA polymerase sigma-70 factor (ECF subfamily)
MIKAGMVKTTLDNEVLEELLRRCARRDGGALERLYAATAPQLLGILVRMLGTRAAAEDALQDVFVRIWQQAGQFDHIKGRALAWIVAITRYRAIDLQRREHPTVVLEEAELAGAEQLRIESPTDDVEFGTAHAALRRCLELLSAGQRECMLLAFQRGLTQQRIAQRVGQPLGTVKSWVRRGLQSLKACLEA